MTVLSFENPNRCEYCGKSGTALGKNGKYMCWECWAKGRDVKGKDSGKIKFDKIG